MARLVPSTVRDCIRELHPPLKDEVGATLQAGATATLGKHIVRAIVDLLDQIPAELIVLSAQDYARFSMTVSVVRNALENEMPGRGVGNASMPVLPPGGRTPLREVYDLLGKCPDQSPSVATTGLEFVSDAQLRESLRMDISAATSALNNHEYKASTVLAGSVIEALLLWGLSELGDQEVRTRTATLQLPKKSLDTWHLGDLNKAANVCGLIDETTSRQAELAQDFRNLIHPGRATRLEATCTLGTAYAALAAVDMVAARLADSDA